MTIESEELGEGPRAAATNLRLSPHQEALSVALLREDPDLLTMYHGALHVLAQPENPDKLALAAHNLRELMNRILRVRSDIQEGTVRLGDKVAGLGVEWVSAAKATSCRDGDGRWSGEIDKSLAGFLDAVTRFFEWLDQHRPKRKQEIATVLQGFDRYGLPLPPVLEDLNVTTWQHISDYFVAVAHHRSVKEEEFAQWQYACERFLIERLQPPTFDHHAELDELIAKGEGRDS